MEKYSVKHNTTNAGLYAALSSIPLDIEGSNIANIGWKPREEDKEFCGGEKGYQGALDDYNKTGEKVLFKNTHVEFDRGEYGSSYPVEISVFENGERYAFCVDDCGIEINKAGKTVLIPTEGVTAFDFYRGCEIVGIKLELSDYALTLLKY